MAATLSCYLGWVGRGDVADTALGGCHFKLLPGWVGRGDVVDTALGGCHFKLIPGLDWAWGCR